MIRHGSHASRACVADLHLERLTEPEMATMAMRKGGLAHGQKKAPLEGGAGRSARGKPLARREHQTRSKGGGEKRAMSAGEVVFRVMEGKPGRFMSAMRLVHGWACRVRKGQGYWGLRGVVAGWSGEGCHCVAGVMANVPALFVPSSLRPGYHRWICVCGFTPPQPSPSRGGCFLFFGTSIRARPALPSFWGRESVVGWRDRFRNSSRGPFRRGSRGRRRRVWSS